MEYSVVVPVYNEVGNIRKLHEEILDVMDKLSKDYEVLYVDDGSTDGTFDELKSLKKAKIISLNRNYGQATALDAGFKKAVGEIIISMDGDLQNDPRDISKMVKKLKDENSDVVSGWRKNRNDKGGLRALTLIGRFLRRRFIKDVVKDTGCTLRVYRSTAAKSLDLQGEMHRYILGLLRWKGFNIGEVEVNHRPRKSGKSKYTYSKAIRGFIDLIYIWFIQKYSQRPLHLFGYLSIFSFIMGFAIEVWMLVERLANKVDVTANGWFIVGFFFLGSSLILFSFGIILDLLIKIKLDTSQNEKRYYIKSVIGV